MEFGEEEFNKKALEFLILSEKLNDNWRKFEKDGKIYLVKNQKIQRLKSNSRLSQNSPLDCGQIEYEDPSCSAAGNDDSEMLKAEYHLVYHLSYQVPVIFFNFFKEDGSLASLEEVWDLFLENTKLEESKNNLLNVITQSEHPILFRPFFMLHPCKVNEVLSTFPNSYLTRNFHQKMPPSPIITLFWAKFRNQMKTTTQNNL